MRLRQSRFERRRCRNGIRRESARVAPCDHEAVLRGAFEAGPELCASPCEAVRDPVCGFPAGELGPRVAELQPDQLELRLARWMPECKKTEVVAQLRVDRVV